MLFWALLKLSIANKFRIVMLIALYQNTLISCSFMETLLNWNVVVVALITVVVNYLIIVINYYFLNFAINYLIVEAIKIKNLIFRYFMIARDRSSLYNF